MIGRDTFWPQASVLTSPAWQVLPDKLPIYQLINGPTLQLFISYTKISSFPAAQLLHMYIVCNWYIGGEFFGVFANLESYWFWILGSKFWCTWVYDSNAVTLSRRSWWVYIQLFIQSYIGVSQQLWSQLSRPLQYIGEIVYIYVYWNFDCTDDLWIKSLPM